jgi:hypothetical protein
MAVEALAKAQKPTKALVQRAAGNDFNVISRRTGSPTSTSR